MFKKFKKTKVILGTSALSAMVVLPIISLVATNENQTNHLSLKDASSGVVATKSKVILDTFGSSAAPKSIQTPENVITVDDLSSSQFTDQDAASTILFDTPKVLDQYISGASDVFNKAASDAILTVGMASAMRVYNHHTGDQAIKTFYSDDKKEKLYKDLNPGMDKHAQTGTRFDFSVPTNIMSITGLSKDKKSLDPTPWQASVAKPFVYKIATIDPTKIAENQALSLDYMYQEGTGNSRKVQLTIPHSQELTDNDDKTTVQDLIDNKEIFFRTMDEDDRATDGDIKNPISLANSGLTIVKDDDGISLYTSLQSNDAKSAIMIDPDTTKDAKTSATVGILGSSTQFGGINMAPKGALPGNQVTDFREYSIKNNWTKNPSYSWANGKGTTAVEQLVFYMKTGTELNNIKMTYDPVDDLKTTISIKAEDLNLTVTPKAAIEVDPSKFSSTDKTFEIKSQHMKDWYKVTLTVQQGASHPFLLGDNDGSAELPWVMEKKTKQSPIFFEDPTSHPNAWTGPVALDTIALQKKINDDAVTEEVYRDVYSSWLDNRKSSMNVEDYIAKELNSVLNIVGGDNVWKGFTYLAPKTGTLDFSDSNAEIKTIAKDATMTDIINQLNTFHNSLVKIEEDNDIDIDDDNKKDSYKPTDASAFDTLLADFIKPAGKELVKTISDKIKEADEITKVEYDKYIKELDLWNKEPDHTSYIAQYTKTGPKADDNVNFFELEKDMSKEDFAELLKTVFPTNKNLKDPDALKNSGDITIAKFVQKDIEAIIPQLFVNEYANFKIKVMGIKGKRFAKFLGTGFDSQTLNPNSIINGVSKQSGIHFSDISKTPTQLNTKNGEELIKGITQLIYKTGFYKTIFTSKPHQKELFLKLYDEKTNDSDLWKKDVYDAGGQNVEDMLAIVNTMINNIQPEHEVADFEAALETQGDATDKYLYVKKLEEVSSSSAKTFLSDKRDVLFKWTVANQYSGTALQKQIILSNIESVVEYLRNNDKAKLLGDKLDGFIKTFTSDQQSNAAIAQLGPTLGRYKIQVFIPAFSNDAATTEEIVEQMVHVDPIRVLIPNTGQSKAFKVLENQGGKATLALVVAAGALIFVLGSALLGLSFTKRLVVGGKTWSVKMVVIRVVLVAIAIAGVYMVLTGIVLPGHEALTTIVNV